MYQVSSEFAEILAQDSRTFHAQISFTDQTGGTISDGVASFVVHGGSNCEDDFALGGTVSQYVEVRLSGIVPNVEDREFLLRIGAEGTMDYMPIGYFKAQKPKSDENQISFTAYDRMLQTEKAFFPQVADSTTTIAVLQEIQRATGVPVDTSGLSAISMPKPEGYTAREVLGYIAQMYGGFACVNRSGMIIITRWAPSGITIRPGRYWDSFVHNDLPVIVQKITVVTGEDEEGQPISVSAGSGPREISFSNPFFTQERVTAVYSIWDQYTYMPGSLTFLGDPRIDPWDTVKIVDLNNVEYTVPVMQITQTFDGGLSTDVTAAGKSEAEQQIDFRGPATRRMDRSYTQLLLIDRALVNKLDAAYANITYAKIENLNATDARIETLSADYGTFKNAQVAELNAAKGDIDQLESTYANIKTLLAGNAGTGELQVIHLTNASAVIDEALIKSVIAQYISVNDLLAGSINTGKFNVISDDGMLQIAGATILLRDRNGNVRMQIGRDAGGDFTFVLYDAQGVGQLINENGIQPSAINDGLIVDRMVSQNANIGASKLNLPSIVDWINNDGTHTISSTAVKTQGGQTVEVAISRVTQDASAAVSSAAAAIQASEQALQVLSGISTLDAMGVSLSNDAHVLHTETDGSGGDYTDCKTTVTVFLGDTDVSDHAAITCTPSQTVQGTWNAAARTFTVTALSGDNGYVDFDCLYGTAYKYLINRAGKNIQSRSGALITARSGGLHLIKRFSISKSKDGAVGLTYRLDASVEIVRKILGTAAGDPATLSPQTVTFTATYNANRVIMPLICTFVIYESTDDSAYTEKYRSDPAETSTQYTITSANVKAVRCEILDPASGDKLADKKILVLVDAETVNTTVQTVKSDLTRYKQDFDELSANFLSLQSDYHGTKMGNLLLQTLYTLSNDTYHLSAKVYRAGKDVTREFAAACYRWYVRSEDNDLEYIGTGYTKDIAQTRVGFGGAVQCWLISTDEMVLTDRQSRIITTRSGAAITVRYSE